jgi:hypothetical protein
MLSIATIAQRINEESKNTPIGDLQSIRKKIKKFKRMPGENIFSPQTIHEDWAFHHGGRRELQFNIGYEKLTGTNEFRFGVAFSLETSQTLPRVDILIPKIKLFNEYLTTYPDEYSDMRMWYWRGERSSDFSVAPIQDELVHDGVFIFMGLRQAAGRINYYEVLECLNRLLPLYIFTESIEPIEATQSNSLEPFQFTAGFTPRKTFTTASLSEKKLSILNTHHLIQKSLFNRLVNAYGSNNVGIEQGSGAGTFIDVVVRNGTEYDFYEIKTQSSAKSCIRESIGQLLEYSYWPGSQRAKKLVIVGPAQIDNYGKEYLDLLRKQFALPLEYECVEV